MTDKELEQKATTYSTNVVTNMKIAQLLTEAYKSGFLDGKQATFPETFKDVASIVKAFNKHKNNLKIQVDSGTLTRPERIYLMNEGVFLRRILEELGFQESDIDKIL